jgi:SAM-dependent methyltransferase
VAASRVRAIVRRRLDRIAYRGDNVECPCCGSRFDRFKPGLTNAAIRVCPRCGSHDRHRALWLWFDRHPELLEPGAEVIHWSPEWVLSRRLRAVAGLRYRSVDLDAGADLQADITDVPLPDASVDLVVCSHVLEHVDDDRAAMSEIARVLRPGGRAVLLVPLAIGRPTLEDPAIVTPEERRRAYWQDDHVRLYGDEDFAGRLRAAGLEVSVDRLAADADESTRARYGLLTDDLIFVARRPVA